MPAVPEQPPGAPAHPLRLFRPVYLTRRPTPVAGTEPLYAALDLETTGLDPRTDRVCEVAVVRFRADGTVVDEYATLINPQGPVRASEFHRIVDADVVDAPTLAEVWPDLLRMMTGCVVVAHNLKFEDGFLTEELARAGLVPPPLVGLCSLVTCRSQLDGPAYSLQSVYRTATEQWIEDSHTALGDCRALVTLVQWLLANAPAPLWLQGPLPEGAVLAEASAPGRMMPRASRLNRSRHGYLGSIARQFPRGGEHPVDPVAAQDYLDALDECAADQRVTGDRARRLERLARRAGFTQQQLVAEHRRAWQRATSGLALAEPDRLPAKTRQRLVRFAHDLGHPDLAADLAGDGDAAADESTGCLRGWRVGLDGSGAQLDDLAASVTAHGGGIAKRITASVRFVAATDPDGDGLALRRARELGVDVLTVADARARVASAVRDAADAERRHRAEAADRRAEQARRAAENDAHFRHRWHAVERPPAWRRSG
ncbi:3'-5' exonuclease [Goodfellowiella coeruleoviolacea]|uniref:3'-5' exonuclease n=1 Tax=Goodfellowiella coeruleoviolacea TaxID=334858 RepID=UPI0020A2EA17|nr:3'-5' exonuclease [Goodfellowiella coeruleoviolacea]